MDLTPKKWRKKKVDTASAKRRVSFRITRHWRNPFQIAIILVALASFVISIIVDRVKESQVFQQRYAEAHEIRTEMEGLHAQAFESVTKLQTTFGNVAEKTVSAEEQEMIDRVSALSESMDQHFYALNDAFAAMAYRFRSREDVLNWFMETTDWCIESALQRNNPEQARLWFNASHVNTLLTNMVGRVKGEGSIEIRAVAGKVFELFVWSMKLDGPRLVMSEHVGRTKELPYAVTDIAKGSYLIMVTRADSGFSPYPVYLGHGEQITVNLEIPEHIPAGMSLVPGGNFFSGGTFSPRYRKHVRNLPSFFIKRHEVTNAEYLAFWMTLDGADKETMMSFVHFPEDKMKTPAWDNSGNIIDQRILLDAPVVGISFEAVVKYCEWKSRETGDMIRLPSEFEWEKAARGVDGRTYVWGYEFDPDAQLAHTLENQKGKAKFPYLAPTGRFVRDVSPYNIYDMAGNARELVESKDGFQVRGGSAFTASDYLPVSHISSTDGHVSDIGFRYVQELP